VTLVAPVLFGERVVLRPYVAGFADDEVALLYRWSRDPAILALAGGSPIDVPFDRFAALFREQARLRNGDREQQFAVLTREGRLIGRAGLFGLAGATGTAELGVVIGEPDCWGRHLGRDAVGTLADFGFDQLALQRIVLYAFPDNVRARRAFAAVGFVDGREVPRFSLERGSHRTLEMVLTPAARSAARARSARPVSPRSWPVGPALGDGQCSRA
jgi:RimJ/RimL family protein N-acetyltransferase